MPKADKITVSADTDIIYKPYFESTSSHWTSPGNAEYCLANGISGNGNLSEAQGGNIDYLNGIHTLTNQFCNYYVDKCDSEFGELRAYIIAKSLQDPYRDLNDDINGFLDAYYGPGGCYIRNIVDAYTEHAGNKDGHLEIYCDSADSMTMKNYTVSQINNWWQQAKDAAETEEQLARVKRSEISWIYYKANAKKDQFSLTNPKRFDEKVRLYEMFEEYGIHVFSEGNEYDDYKDCISVKFTIPDEWDMYEPGETGAETRYFFGEILEFLIPFLTGFGLLHKIYKALMPIHF